MFFKVKNVIILALAVICAMLLVDRFFIADYTMSQDQANRLAKPVMVFMYSGVQEDDLWIADEDRGRVDFVRTTATH